MAGDCVHLTIRCDLMADRGMLELFQPWRGKAQATAESVVVSNVTTSRTVDGERTYRVVNGAETVV